MCLKWKYIIIDQKPAMNYNQSNCETSTATKLTNNLYGHKQSSRLTVCMTGIVEVASSVYLESEFLM